MACIWQVPLPAGKQWLVKNGHVCRSLTPGKHEAQLGLAYDL